MAGFKSGPEAMVEAMVALMQNGYPGPPIAAPSLATALTTIWNAWNDAATTPLFLPAQYLAWERDVHGDLPAIEVDWLPGQQTDTMATTYGLVTHNLVVTAWIQADSYPTLRRIASRYVWGMWDVMMKGQRLDGSISNIVAVHPRHYLDNDPGPHRQKGGPLRQAVGWQVEIPVEESTF